MFFKFLTTLIILILCLMRTDVRPVRVKKSSLILREKAYRKYPTFNEKSYRNSITISKLQEINNEIETCTYDKIFNCDYRPLTLKPMDEKSVKKLSKSFGCPEVACPGTDFMVGLFPFNDLPGKSSTSDVTRIFNNAIYNKLCPGISTTNINMFGVCLHMCKTDAECNQLHQGWHCCPIRELVQDQFILSCVPPMKH